jgi:hypothetical protein
VIFPTLIFPILPYLSVIQNKSMEQIGWRGRFHRYRLQLQQRRQCEHQAAPGLGHLVDWIGAPFAGLALGISLMFSPTIPATSALSVIVGSTVAIAFELFVVAFPPLTLAFGAIMVLNAHTIPLAMALME